MKKKLAAAVICGVMALSLAACGGSSSASSSGSGSSSETTASSGSSSDSTAASSGSASSSEAVNTSSGTAASSAASGNSNALIVYFDYSENMGDTSGMSADAITSASLDGSSYDGVDRNDLLVMKDEIQKQTGADVFSVQVTEPYDPDYNKMVSQAQDDQNENKQFKFTEDLPDLSGYDTIYMGMPVWWGQLPQPMVCLLDQYDFSGKTIIPFGINLGSGFGQMIDEIEREEPDATVKEDGLTENAHTANSEVISDVDEWLQGLS